MLGSVDVGKRSVADYEATAGREAVERLRALAEPLRGARVLHLMGLVLGPVLGLAQWLALHRFVRRAALWMPANALAWAFGMVVIFAEMDLPLGGGFGPGTVPILALTLLWCGATVGAIHGLALMWLLRSARRLDPRTPIGSGYCDLRPRSAHTR